jgi:hypothetical protein
MENPTGCEIALLCAFFMLGAAEICCELCAVYGQNVMNEETVRQRCIMFKDGQTSVYGKERSGWPCVVSDSLVQSVDQKICEIWHFTIAELLCEFPQISCTVLYEIITIRLGCCKICTTLVPEMLIGAHKMQRMAMALTFLECYHKNSDEFLSHIIRVTGDDTWVSFMNVETKEQSKHWMRTHSPNKPKKFKQTSARKLMAGVFWGRKGVLMVEFM